MTTPHRHRIELRHVPECANVDGTRRLLHDVVKTLGVSVEVEELEGDFPSPSVLVDGVDVMGDPGFDGGACRLDLPTRQRLETYLRPLAGGSPR